MLTDIARYDVTQFGSTINAVQKEIGMKKKVGLTAAIRCGGVLTRRSIEQGGRHRTSPKEGRIGEAKEGTRGRRRREGSAARS